MLISFTSLTLQKLMRKRSYNFSLIHLTTWISAFVKGINGFEQYIKLPAQDGQLEGQCFKVMNEK